MTKENINQNCAVKEMILEIVNGETPGDRSCVRCRGTFHADIVNIVDRNGNSHISAHVVPEAKEIFTPNSCVESKINIDATAIHSA